jgi:DNA-binding CsgD family transcriptional regulator
MRNEVHISEGMEKARALEATGYIDDELFSARERDRLPFFRELTRPQGIRSQLVFTLSFRQRPLARLFLSRHGGRRFRAPDLERMRPLLPALATAHASVALSRPPDEEVKLTPRERQIGFLVAQGYRNQNIAALLGTSPFTVRNQLAALFEKLRVGNRVELAARFSTK